MSNPKTMPFNRIRVMVVAETGTSTSTSLLPARRVVPDPRRVLERAWRDLTPLKAAWVQAAVRRTAGPMAGSAEQAEEALHAGHDASEPSNPEPAPQQDDATSDWLYAEPDTESCTDGVAVLATKAEAGFGAAPHGEPLAVAPPPSSAVAQHSVGTRVGTAAPLAAVARAVEEAAVVKALVAMLVDTCGDESTRETGPWDISLSLQSFGLGESHLDLHLSRELLSLRFHCLGPGVASLLSRHRNTLLGLLQQQLHPQLVIEIAIVDA